MSRSVLPHRRLLDIDERLEHAAASPAPTPFAFAFAFAFADIVRHLRGYPLMECIRHAERDAPKPMEGFAGLRREDVDAVTANLTLL
ncbi:hypothetical protein [Streptomyces hundungensis]|uniref:hypothetical protein n=1 Tax=Streptomyces hundungensis TaxID=1077946 RepID=UPI0033CC65D4